MIALGRTRSFKSLGSAHRPPPTVHTSPFLSATLFPSTPQCGYAEAAMAGGSGTAHELVDACLVSQFPSLRSHSLTKVTCVIQLMARICGGLMPGEPAAYSTSASHGDLPDPYPIFPPALPPSHPPPPSLASQPPLAASGCHSYGAGA